MDFFKKVIGVGSGSLSPNFPYVIDDLVTPADGRSSLWEVHGAHDSSTSVKKNALTILVGKHQNRPQLLTFFKNYLKRVKTLRHPLILKYLNGFESPNEVMIATERVRPLSLQLDELRKTPESILWIKVLKFLNEEAGIIHGNLIVSSVFVTDAGELRLGGWEVTSSIRDEEPCLFASSRSCVDSQSWPPEIYKSDWDSIRRYPVHCVDSFMLANLIEVLFQGIQMPMELATFVKDASRPDPSRRSKSSSLLSSPIFHIKVIEFAEKLDEVAVMEVDQREALLLDVNQNLKTLSLDFIAFKVIPSLKVLFDNINQTSSEAVNLFCSCLTRLDQGSFSKQAQSVLESLFAKPDRVVRLCLLKAFPLYYQLLDSKATQEGIFPHLINGFTDAQPLIREETLKSSLLVAPKLTTRQLNGELLRFYARLQSDDQPGIRVNTIICISKITEILDEESKKKTLGPAILRSLRDPFPPTKLAALTALGNVLDTLNIEEVAKNIFPLIVPLTVDEDSSIRNKSIHLSRILIDKIEIHGKTMSCPSSSDCPQRTTTSLKSSSWMSVGALTSKLMGNKMSPEGVISPSQENSLPTACELANEQRVLDISHRSSISHSITSKMDLDSTSSKTTPSYSHETQPSTYGQDMTKSTDLSGRNEDRSLDVDDPWSSGQQERSLPRITTVKSSLVSTSRPSGRLVLGKKPSRKDLFDDL